MRVDMVDATLSLAGDFPVQTESDWRALAEAGLKGRPLDKLTVRVGGLQVRPLYTGADAREGAEGWPGFAPYTRGAHPGRQTWTIHQAYRQPDLRALNREILTDLERGVMSIELELDGACRTGRDLRTEALQGDGAPIARVDDLELVLAGVYDDLAPVMPAAGAAGGPAAALFLALARRRQRDPSTYVGQLNIDPVSAWSTEDSPLSLEQQIGIMVDVAAYACKTWPHIRTARIDGTAFHDAGATAVDEVAAMLATGVAYLTALTNAGLSTVDAARHIVLRTAVDADLFMGVAKLRALRQAWTRILTASGAATAVPSLQLQASTSRPMMTARDPWVNILRTTVACFAGAVGGADVLHVRPFDDATRLPDALARRIARNTQVILQDETHLGQVIDPAGGAWYVEQLTMQLAAAAWSRFQQIESDGGIAAVLRTGELQDRIDSAWGEREAAIARRKEPLTGVSEFPNLAETPLAPSEPAPPVAANAPRPSSFSWASGRPVGACTADAVASALDGATLDQLMAAYQHAVTPASPRVTGPAGAPRRPLIFRSRAAGFETLRDASDEYLAQHGRRPQILIATLGSIAESTARATYAKNFFEAGGVEPVSATVDEDDLQSIVNESGVRAAVLTSTDERYAADVETVAPRLKAAGIQKLYLAGRPGDREPAYRAAGVDEFIYIGVDVRSALARMHAELFTTHATTEGDES